MPFIYNSDCFNSHGDGSHITNGIHAIRNARSELGMDVRYLASESDVQRFGLRGDEDWLLVHEAPPMEMPKYLDLHAGAFETGMVAAYFPDLVNDEIARKLEPTQLTMQSIGKWVQDVRGTTPLGYVGDPAGYDAKEARVFWDATCKMAADAIEEFVKKK